METQHYFVQSDNSYLCSATAERLLAPRSAVPCDVEPDLELVLRVLRAGFSVLVSGPAGAGKSHLLRRLVTWLQNEDPEPKRRKLDQQESKESCQSKGQEKVRERVVVTAPTGIAAYNVQGSTLHSRLGLGLAEASVDELWARISDSPHKFARARKFLYSAAVLVIDEISMVHPTFFEKLLALRQRACGRPWRMVMVGDFLQLGPVFKEGEERRFVFETDAWKNLRLARVWLQRCFRQDQDPQFLALLNSLRSGRLSEHGLALLQSRVVDSCSRPSPDLRPTLLPRLWDSPSSRGGAGSGREGEAPCDANAAQPSSPASCGSCCPSSSSSSRSSSSSSSIPSSSSSIPSSSSSSCPSSSGSPSAPSPRASALEPLDIFPYRKDADDRNAARLAQLRTQQWHFRPTVRVCAQEGHSSMSAQDQREAESVAKDEKKLGEKFPVHDVSLAVGAQVMLRVNLPSCRSLCNGSLGLVRSVEPGCVRVQFYSGQGCALGEETALARHTFRAKVGPTAEVCLTQFPLALGWASTIHKAQSLTLATVRTDGRRCFEGGQFYVAVSRVPSLRGLTLTGFSRDSVMANPKAVQFEDPAQHGRETL